jgi:hypothetical protein
MCSTLGLERSRDGVGCGDGRRHEAVPAQLGAAGLRPGHSCWQGHCADGANGAGKTTLLNILTGLTTPTTGTVSILDGVVPGSQQGHDRVAYVAQDTPVYSELRVRDHLLVAADLNLRWDQDFASDRLDQLGIPMLSRVRRSPPAAPCRPGA